ncbi:hypothetical protein SAMN04487965_2794 [Microbulbifer donghaiensis]|uniref:Lipoprotein n=1 Tax=Microbulbifer donghaiensis TaxID=494016 RepID=A0A1M5F4A7_9GAMM|nr:hypothetical protein [Microbulbifer donghaiensis]SHF86440.1 hypothetical protein SAMN04487965_2794 [Microbulbifer donghaiensis]
MLKKITLLAMAMLVTACVSPVSLQEQSAAPEYQVKESVLISVIDQRQRVKEGKDKTFVGKAHASFGIPVDWHVKQVLATEPGDKEKDLAQFLQSRLVHGLNSSGWNATAVDLAEVPQEDAVKQLMEQNNANKMISLVLNEWYFSLNLNWVSAFNFDTDTNILVYDLQNGKLLAKNIKERDVVDEQASQSPQNNVLLAYKAQLDQIVNDSEVRQVMSFD